MPPLAIANKLCVCDWAAADACLPLSRARSAVGGVANLDLLTAGLGCSAGSFDGAEFIVTTSGTDDEDVIIARGNAPLDLNID